MARPQNPKEALNLFLQKELKLDLAKGSVKYTSNPGAIGGFQSSVTLSCLGNQRFVGDICPDKKAAESSAAMKAVANVQRGAGAPPTAGEKKRLKPQAVTGQAVMEGKVEGDIAGQPQSKKAKKMETPSEGADHRDTLKDILSSILKINIETSDVNYVNKPLADGAYQCTAKVPVLPGYESAEIAGEVAVQQKTLAETKKLAIQHAAAQVISTILADDYYRGILEE